MKLRFAAIPRAARLGAVLGAIAIVWLAGAGASAETPTIYKWVDSNGVAHYTTDKSRIPSEIRTRVERAAPIAPVTVHPEDEMRHAVPVKPRGAISAPAADPLPEPAPDVAAPAPQPVAPAPTPDEETPVARVEEIAPTPVEEIPPPLAEDVPDDIDPVSAPPPAPLAPLAPSQSAEIAKLDGQIEQLEGEIAQREEKLAALISSADEQRATPLVDDPAFREIAQRLPKLQAELQTLRERRNKIQPPATP